MSTIGIQNSYILQVRYKPHLSDKVHCSEASRFSITKIWYAYWVGLSSTCLSIMQCRQENTNCLPELKPCHNLSILGDGKITQTVILPHDAKKILPSSFRNGNRSQSVNFQRVHELESLFLEQEQESKKWLRSTLVESPYQYGLSLMTLWK